MTKILWTSGYTAAELERAQTRFRISFPPDLVELLRNRRPVEGPDWNDEQEVVSSLAWPFEGLLIDVEKKGLWWPEWGDRPTEVTDREDVLRAVVSKAPKLIPILAHRYLPATPNVAGNPIFSVYGSDTIHYGANLADYFDREENRRDEQPWTELREIDFWSELVRRNGSYDEPEVYD